MRKHWACALGGSLLVLGGCMELFPIDPYEEESVTNDGSGAQASGGTGEGGAGGDSGKGPSCESYRDCLEWSLDAPVACIEDHCALLRSDECKGVVGQWDDDDAVLIGAFASFGGKPLEQSQAYLHYRLVLDSFENNQWPRRDNKSYPVAMVLCDSTSSTDSEENFANIHAGAEHLIDDLKVPGVISFLLPTELGKIFEEFVSEPENPVLFLNPGGGTKSLVDLNWDQRLWHTLGQPSDYVPAFVAAMKEADSLAKERWSDVTETRIALVYDSDGVDEAFRGRLTENEAFKAFTDPKAELAETSYRAFSLSEGISDASAAILDYEPHIVLSLVGNQVKPFVEQLETAWTVVKGTTTLNGPMITKLPYFVFSPTAIFNTGLFEHFKLLNQRIGPVISTFTMNRYIAVGAKSPSGDGLAAYQQDWGEAHAAIQATQENVFDAAYAMIYAVQAAGPPSDLSRLDLRDGFLRLLGREGDTEVLVGRDHLADSLFQLANPNVETFRFVGAMGPARYDSITGVQPAEPVISCVREVNLNWRFADPTHELDDTGALTPLDEATPFAFHRECFGEDLEPVSP